MTHSFNFDKGSIRLVVSHRGKQYKKATGLTTEAALWRRDAKTLRAKCKDARILARLLEIDSRAHEKEAGVVSDDDCLRVIQYALTGAMPAARVAADFKIQKVSFWEYFEEWVNRPSTQVRQKKLCYNNVARFMGKEFTWEDVDSAFHFRLVQKMRDAGFGINYQWKTVSQLKTVMNEGRKLKYHSNLEYQDFKTKREDPDTIYLTGEEVEALWNYRPKGELDRKARDLFLLGVYSCARYSDYSRLTLDMIQDGVIRFTQVKTANSVLVPASPRLVAILKRNGGRAPALAQQHLNEWIKKVCRGLGITEKVDVTSSDGVKHTTERKEKCDLVSSHTARRTGITLLYMTGIPLQQVMLISGHKDEDSIRHYLRLTKQENASILKDNPFFK